MSGRLILDHFRNPRNAGHLSHPDGFGIEMDNPWAIAISIALRVRKGIIQQVRFEAQGCVTAIACASMLTELVEGQSVKRALSISHRELSEALGTVPEEKLHCCGLAIGALRKAINDSGKGRPAAAIVTGSGDKVSDNFSLTRSNK